MTTVAAITKRRLPVLTQSSLTTFRRCPREYFFSYVLNRKGRRKSAALRFGSLYHRGLNAWWSATAHRVDFDARTFTPLRPTPEARFASAVEAMRRYALEEGEFDAFDLVKAECLMAGYTARWCDEPYETIAVEKRFDTRHGDAFDLHGSIDAIARNLADASIIHNVESKTTSQDISAGSNYWRRVIALDSQVSTYMVASREMGYDVRDTIYDVTRKPEIVPLKATPEESRKYTKPTKAEPIPRLYKGQREEDETLDEYRDRLAADIVARPDWYYARQTIVRLEHDDEEHAKDVVATAEMIAHAEERGAWPRSPNACERYRRLCDFFEVCSGETTIEDGTRFESKVSQHEELT